jgi:hypothetical protein
LLTLAAAVFQAGELQAQAQSQAGALQKEFYLKTGREASRGTFQILPKPNYRKTSPGTDVEWLASDGRYVFIQIAYRVSRSYEVTLHPVGDSRTFYLQNAEGGQRGELVFGYWVGHKESVVRMSGGGTIRLRLVLDRIQADTVSIMEGNCTSGYWCFQNIKLQNKIDPADLKPGSKRAPESSAPKSDTAPAEDLNLQSKSDPDHLSQDE